MTEWIEKLVEQFGYFGITLLMLLENLFPPLPSELIMPLAGYAAARGDLSLPGVILSGLAGTTAGALTWYAIGRWTSEERLRRWADRHGRWLTLSRKDIDRIDGWFGRHCRWAVPVGHLIPTIRTLISVPAGLFGMHLPRFLILTMIGAGIWTSLLAVLGHALGSAYGQIDRYIGPFSAVIMGGIVASYLFRVATYRRRSR